MSKINKEKMMEEVIELMDKNQKISCSSFQKKYKCSDTSFYNIMKEFGIKVSEYNKSLLQDNMSELGFSIEKRAENDFAKKESKTIEKNDSFSIERREKKPVATPRINFRVNPKFVASSSPSVEIAIEEEPAVAIAKGEIVDYVPSSQQYLLAGLISDRHSEIDSTTKLFVFKGPIAPRLINDYEKLYSLAEAFIDEKVIGAGYHKMKVMITGLTQCVTSLIKVCINKNIDLTLLHYDNGTCKYREQVIIGDEAKEMSLVELFSTSKKGYAFKLISHDAKYYERLKTLFTVKVEDVKTGNAIVYITDDMDEMFSVYGKEVQKSMFMPDTTIRIIANELGFGITNAEYSFKNTFGTYSNNK